VITLDFECDGFVDIRHYDWDSDVGTVTIIPLDHDAMMIGETNFLLIRGRTDALNP
jgi:hypothetical protein